MNAYISSRITSVTAEKCLKYTEELILNYKNKVNIRQIKQTEKQQYFISNTFNSVSKLLLSSLLLSMNKNFLLIKNINSIKLRAYVSSYNSQMI